MYLFNNTLHLAGHELPYIMEGSDSESNGTYATENSFEQLRRSKTLTVRIWCNPVMFEQQGYAHTRTILPSNNTILAH